MGNEEKDIPLTPHAKNIRDMLTECSELPPEAIAKIVVIFNQLVIVRDLAEEMGVPALVPLIDTFLLTNDYFLITRETDELETLEKFMKTNCSRMLDKIKLELEKKDGD